MDKVTLSRQELYDLVWEMPMLTIAKKYAISDVGLRKACLRMDIPVPSVGYWQKLQFGKKTKKIPLPKRTGDETRYTLKLRDEENPFTRGMQSPQTIREQEIEKALGAALTVPERFNRPSPLVVEAQANLARQKADEYLYKGTVQTSVNVLDIRVAPKNVGRALRFMDTLIKALELRGHTVKNVNNKTYAVINGRDTEISFKERLKKEIVSDGNYKHTEYHPTDLLYFKMNGYHEKEWIDGKLKVEAQLSKIITRLELGAEKWNEMLEEYRRQEEVRLVKEQKEKEKWAQKERELTLFKNLLNESKRWQEVQLLRSYVADVESMAKRKSEDVTDTNKWLDWAKSKIDWYDPYVNSDDELLKDVDKETLAFKVKPSYRGW